MGLVNEIRAAIEGRRIAVQTEADTQEDVAIALTEAGIVHDREVWIGPRSRIDFLCDHGIGIEVKVRGSAQTVARQLQRYEAAPDLKHLILVTRRSINPQPAGLTIPFSIVWLSKAWL